MKRLCVVIAMLMVISAVGCGNNKVADSGAASGTVSEPDAVEASTLGVPVVKGGVLRPGEDCAEVVFDWNPVEGADGYEVSEENKYYSEKEYRESETVEITDNSYVTGAQDYFDFRIKVRAFKGGGADRIYGEWSSFATGSAYEMENVAVGGPYGEMSVVIPEGWTAEISAVDDGKLTYGLYGLILKPKSADEGQIGLFCSDSFGVCGTGLSQEETTIAGYTAHVGTYDDHEHWDFITFGDERPQIVAQSIDCDSWIGHMWEEADTILDTLKFDTSRTEGGIGQYISDSEVEALGLMMSVSNVTTSGLTVHFRQYYDKNTGELIYGEDYTLEELEGEKWEAVPTIIDNGVFTDIGYNIPKNGEAEIETNWEWLYGKLEPGTYKITNLATAIRTCVVVVMAWVMVFITSTQGGISSISRKSWIFLILSGLATGASWLCYYKALQMGEASKVVPIDKLSVVITLVLAFVFLHEKFTAKSLIGCVLIGAGTLIMVI